MSRSHRRDALVGLVVGVALALVGILGAGLIRVSVAPAAERPHPVVTHTATATPSAVPTSLGTAVRIPSPTASPERVRHTATPAATHKPTITPAARPAPVTSPVRVPPFLVLVDPTTDADWQVTRALNVWNHELGCRLFVTVGDGHSTYQVVTVKEGPALLDGKPMHGLTTLGGPVAQVELNPRWSVDWHVSLHELGHVAGLPHDHDPAGVMNVDLTSGGKAQVANTVSVPSGSELAAALDAQAGRCGR